jgi:ABC-type multidrug transport system fused ATPase/permease subunit
MMNQKLRIIRYFFAVPKTVLGVLVILTVLQGALEMASVGAIIPVLDAGVAAFTPESADGSISSMMKSFYLSAGTFLNSNYLITSGVILAAVTVFAFLYKVFFLYISQKFMAYLWVIHQQRVYSILSDAEYFFYLEQNQGKLIYNSAVATESIAAVIESSIRGVSEIIKALFLFGLLFAGSWRMTLVVIVIGAIYTLFSKYLIKVMVNKSSEKIVYYRQKQHKNLNEFISGIKTIKVFNRTKVWMDQYIEMARNTAQLTVTIIMGMQLPGFIIQLTIGVLIAVMAMYVGNQPIGEVVELVPLLGLFVVVSNRINGAVSTAITYFAGVSRNFPNLAAIFELLNSTPTVVRKKQLGKQLAFENEICFKNVSFSFQNSPQKVLNGISFSIPKNNTIALVGASGGGKTTTLNLLLRLFENYSGEILVDGVEVREINYESYLNAIGFVSQEPFLFNGTIFENISFGVQVSLSEVKEACMKADAHCFIEKLDQKYSTIVGDSGIKLSGGQKQRIGIARALVKKPSIMILDEPTSALDNESERNIQETLGKLSKSLTVILVAHRLSTVQNADKIVVLKNGCIVEEGMHQELIALNGYYSNLYRESDPAKI